MTVMTLLDGLGWHWVVYGWYRMVLESFKRKRKHKRKGLPTTYESVNVNVNVKSAHLVSRQLT